MSAGLQRLSQLDAAYTEACRKRKRKVYNARMILAGYSEAGKTSLAKRLLGNEFNDNEKRTEGIALHHIESTFNNNEKQKKGGRWVRKNINTSHLNSIFSDAIWSTAREMSGEDSLGNSSTGGKRPLMENNEENGTHGEAKRRRTQSDVPAISDETIKELIENEDVTVEPESEEQMPFTLSVWDLGGQDEFISTQHLFFNTEATILIVMDITKGLHKLMGGKSELGYLNSPADVLYYWLNLVHTDALKQGRTPNIAIVLTHTDQIKGSQKKYINDYKKQIMDLIKDKPYFKYIDKKRIYAVSNATGSYADFQKLKDKILQHLIEQPTWGYDMPVRWLKLKHNIITKSNGRGTKYLHLTEIWELGEELMMDNDDVENFLKTQTTLGDFVYFPELRDLVITDPQWLIDKCEDLISTHVFIDKRRKLNNSIRQSLKQGKITETSLRKLWKNDGVVFLIKLMEKYDLLVDVSDNTGRKYIIPSLLDSNFHKEVSSKVLIGSFPQFVSKCSKEKNWKLTLKDLSYTNATLDIGDGVKLSLSLSQPVQIQTNFVWPEEKMHLYDRDKIQRETKASLARILKTCQIETADDEGSVPLFLL